MTLLLSDIKRKTPDSFDEVSDSCQATTSGRDGQFMSRALALAQLAANLGEVPVGAVVVVNDQVVGEGINRREARNCCLEHAEINAIKDASSRLGTWRLVGATIYSTLEPCIMCASAMVHARISRLVYGAADGKFGGIESLYRLAHDTRLNHQFAVTKGLMGDNAAELLRNFFVKLREEKSR